uniref:Uncharacterized protein n=1 Tax=Picea glauca TaxID=3330 RepID=A0A101LU92_PICGL|nr:hypothetical protein ABT39_MTgene3493 [Picea glauca]
MEAAIWLAIRSTMLSRPAYRINRNHEHSPESDYLYRVNYSIE